MVAYDIFTVSYTQIHKYTKAVIYVSSLSIIEDSLDIWCLLRHKLVDITLTSTPIYNPIRFLPTFTFILLRGIWFPCKLREMFLYLYFGVIWWININMLDIYFSLRMLNDTKNVYTLLLLLWCTFVDCNICNIFYNYNIL